MRLYFGDFGIFRVGDANMRLYVGESCSKFVICVAMIKYQKDTDNIVTLRLDMKGRSVNVINHEIGEAFIPVIEHLMEEKAKGALRGVIITSDKKTFLAGGDLDYLYKNDDPAEVFQFAEKLKRFFRDLERPGIPVVAAINGTALASGFEMTLACHYRIALDRSDIQLGLPEVRLGLMPGSGGTIRLMWKLGIAKAFPILTEGRRYTPKEALDVGIIDELAATEEEMLTRAKEWLMKTAQGRQPWDEEGTAIPGGVPGTPAGRRLLGKLSAQLVARYHNNYPAPRAIFETMVEGAKVDFDTACRIETRQFTRLVCSDTAANMTKAFWYDYNDLRNGVARPKGYGKFRPRKIGVVGAGLMGSGIAYSCVRYGIEVVLKDVSSTIAERGRALTEEGAKALEAADRITLREKNDMIARLTTTEDNEDFSDCDLVIEAVFENLQVKQKVIRDTEKHLDEYAILASNTSGLLITSLASAAQHPENYVGLHFFVPAHDRKLVEIVRGEHTSEETIARAYDFVRKIHKLPVIVKDNPGFFVNRVMNTYLLEGIAMLAEGIPAAVIENIGIQIGMPLGPLALADETGLHQVLATERTAKRLYGAKYQDHPAGDVLQAMIESHDRSGKQHGTGFYNYHEGERTTLWEGIPKHYPHAEDYDRTVIGERLLLAQVLESYWCYQEGIIGTVAEANIASIFGWGFPQYTGGVLQYIDSYGKAALVERCEALQAEHGRRFMVPDGFMTVQVA